MSILTAAAAAALAVAVPFAPAAIAGDALEAAPSAETTRIVEVDLNSDGINVAWGQFGYMEIKKFGKHTCPDETPYLVNQEFHKWSGWNIPNGVRIAKTASLLWVDLQPAGDLQGQQVGIAANGRIGNYLRDNTVHIYLHCTDRKPAA